MAAEHVASAYMFSVALALGLLATIPAAVQSIGVCYGVNGDGLPSASDVVQMYQSNRITGMRIYFPDADALQALSGSNIELIIDVANEDLASLASDPSAATAWVQTNVQAHQGVTIKYIAAGNEVGDQGGDTGNILPAMQNLDAALAAAGLGGIKVSTSVSQRVTDGFPPSQGTFSSGAASYMAPIAQYLATTGAPLLANVYPYFSYVRDQAQIDINYALFKSQGTVVQDGANAYQNLFDAIVDTFYSALESAGAGSVGVVVSESGWPSEGGTAATTDNAQTYNQNLIKHIHVGQGTPKRPGAIEAYVFAMFNENRKGPAEIEKHFGLFNPDKSPAYPISF
ncbi:beta-1,3-glucanase 2a [Hordeum vulgare]|nr:beta-1,3-glucanase 2a [Hordeum vulgare]